MTLPDLEHVRADFPALRDPDAGPIVYLDSAASTLRPEQVIDAVADYYRGNGANIHRGKHYLSELASDRYENARLSVAEFLGARAAEVVFVRNTTEALNLVAGGLGLTPADSVVTTLDAHHSNLLPWRAHASVRTVPVLPSGEVDLDAYERELRREPRVVALTACSNVTGVRPPVERMVKQARDAGALVVVDAAQYVPHRGNAFRDLGADFIAFSAHKMCGPAGVGVLCGRLEALEQLRPTAIGGGTVDWVSLDETRIRRVPHRFEYGTPDIAGVIGLGATVDYLEGVGLGELAAHDSALARMLLDACAASPRLTVIGGDASLDRSAIVSVAIEGVARLEHVARALSDSYGVMCRSGHLCAQPLVDHLAGGPVLRLSAYLYNTPTEIETALDALEEIVRAL
ncbi:cysteine desulfurase [Micromonospora sp. NPDC007271]|uniref:aminotransferase class V-fold PLP-dependent enzyme n=1 Tax=Micromonospora sp. NPDC007271 TaxID=3154587 RepID=UPI0033E38555